MNTGKKIETERLLLVPGSNTRDDAHFIHMLRTARTYAKCKRKVSETGRIASEGTRVQDILW